MQITSIDYGFSAAPLAPALSATTMGTPRPPDAVLPGVAVQRAGEASATASPSLDDAASRMEQYVASVGRSLQFRVDQDSGQVVVSVRVPSTGELIRQIPSEAALKIAEQLTRDPSSVSGVIIDGLA